MAVPLNFTIEITDSTVNGIGPYINAIARKNPTFPSGGTVLATLTNSVGTLNPIELISQLQGFITDSIAAANQSDSLN